MIYTFDTKTIAYKKIDNKVILAILAGIIGITFFLIDNLKEVKFISSETRSIILKEQNEFSRSKLKSYILELNIRFPHIVLAQSQLETSNYTSPIFKENRNLFGMKIATKRPTTNKGEENGHAYYDNWRESVVDYAFLQAAYLRDVKTEKEYFQYLKQNYAQDTSYVPKLIQIIKENKFGDLKLID